MKRKATRIETHNDSYLHSQVQRRIGAYHYRRFQMPDCSPSSHVFDTECVCVVSLSESESSFFKGSCQRATVAMEMEGIHG